MKIIMLFTLLSLTLGCISTKQISNDNFYGKYIFGGGYGNSAEIEINKDNTFVYSWKEGLNAGVTKGIWRKESNALVLNSEKQADEILGTTRFRILEKGKKDQRGTTIKVVDENNYPVRLATCFILVNDEKKIGRSSDEYGICFFEKDNLLIKEIFIDYAGYYPIKYQPDESDDNYFKIRIKKEDPHYVVFNNQQWVIKSGIRKKCLFDGSREFCKIP